MSSISSLCCGIHSVNTVAANDKNTFPALHAQEISAFGARYMRLNWPANGIFKTTINVWIQCVVACIIIQTYYQVFLSFSRTLMFCFTLIYGPSRRLFWEESLQKTHYRICSRQMLLADECCEESQKLDIWRITCWSKVWKIKFN